MRTSFHGRSLTDRQIFVVSWLVMMSSQADNDAETEREVPISDVVFETAAPVMFSPLEKTMGVTFKWKAWKSRVLSVKKDGVVHYRKNVKDTTFKEIFRLTKVKVVELNNNIQSQDEREGGIVVHCQTMDGFDTMFRCILNGDEALALKAAIQLVTSTHNLDYVARGSLTGDIQQSVNQTASHKMNKSVMRRAVARAMDKADRRSVEERIRSRRGALHGLPVFFMTDLVHGSWWFTIGSILFVATSAMLLVNSYDDYLGSDDSTLNTYSYRISWILMTVCGVFCTLGSMAFMRAVHEDPPMKPLFSWYHLQSDELLGSWLFVGANLPFIPYALLYLATEESNLEYLGALAISVCLMMGSGLFVMCCYPSDKPRLKVIQPIAFALCCCFCGRDWMKKHFNNDWLAATWLIYWGTWVATIICLALLVKSLYDLNGLQIFIYATGLVESVMFLIGAAYFVAGSYPESLTMADLDSEHSMHHTTGTTVHATPVMFSPQERKLGLSVQWKPWKPRSISIGINGVLMVRKGDNDSPITGTLRLNKVDITEMSGPETFDDPESVKENGIIVNCQDMQGYDTSFRCVFSNHEFDAFKTAVRQVAKEHNVDNLRHSDIAHHINPSSPKNLRGPATQSVMRRAVARAMDLYDVRSRHDQTVARRGAMKYLPVLFSNDLVHGSWWFTIGSILFAVTSVFILFNSFTSTLGEDDSDLDGYHYRATWLFMVISGVFFTLSSMAFMRAVHDDPPIKPLFSWYHLQNDELLGSWLLLLANIPVVPYAMIYLAKDRENWVYWGALVVSVIFVIGSTLFVQACYPSTKPRRKIIQPAAFVLCYCFLRKSWMRKHLSNDWLAGCWFIFWGTLLCTLVVLVLALISVAQGNGLQSFIYGSGLLESICFSIGSAYFVTGSYPEGSLVAGDNDYWDNFESAPPDVTDFDEPNPFFVGKNAAIGSSVSGVKVVGGSSSSVGYMKVNTEEKEEELRLKLLDNDQLHHY